jgi:hypothetical protein
MPRGFGDQGMGRPVNPFSAPVSPFSDAGIRRPVTPFAPAAQGQPRITFGDVGMGRPVNPYTAPMKDQSRIASTAGPPIGFTKDQSRIMPTDPQADLGFSGMPPMGGSLPPDMAKAFGEWGVTRTPPAAPHLGTPASQTAQTEAEPSFWEKGADMFQQASTAVTEKLAENKKMVEEIEKKVGPLTPEKVKMWAWFNGLGGGAGTGSLPEGRGGNGGDIRYPTITPPSQQAPQQAAEPDYTPADLIALKSRMVAAGASPEEIAFVDSLINQTA